MNRTLGVLISGRGSNLQAIVDAIAAGRLDARVGVVISNRPEAAGLERARAAGIETLCLSHRAHPTREAYDLALVAALRQRGVGLVCLAGFMRLLGPGFVNAFPQAILNVHPSLLPAFPGLDAQRQAWAHGAKVSGATVHLVDCDLDAGPIVLQAAVPVLDDDTPESLAARILVEEHRIYPEAIRLVLDGRWRVEGRRFVARQYPAARKSDQVDDFFGQTVADPYRWLEDPDSEETRAWIEAENRLTFDYLAGVPGRQAIRARLAALWDYERFGAPSREGPHYIYARNAGLQNQAVLFKTTSLDGPAEVLIDPNALSEKGTVALGGLSFSDDGRLMAYALAESGSDWLEWRVRDVATAADLPDVVRWSKFSGAAWTKDGSGFFYGRYDAPGPGEALQAVNKNQKVCFHAVGTGQEEDRLVYERPDHPEWGFGAAVTDDGRFLVIVQTQGTDYRNRVFLRDLADPGGAVAPFLDAFDASYAVVGNDGDLFYVLTNNGAPRYRLVAIDRHRPDPSSWRELIPEGPGREVLDGVAMVNEQFLCTWSADAHNLLRVYERDGRPGGELPLPGIGSVVELTGRREHREAFYAFTSFTSPTTVYRHDFTTGVSEAWRKPDVPFDAEAFETVQVFYPSKDGTRVPMFLTHRKGLARDGRHPVYLYGYGGFDIALTPAFSPAMAAWLEMGGVYAVANVRGGSEYGQAWYDAGRLGNKQNAFDDFIAAAEYLVASGYTCPDRIAIAGASNGGLLVGACMTQRPELFGAALPSVGVLDLLRYHKFTIGWAWKSDYGDPDAKDGFDLNIKYSPLHNLRPGTRYPATLITTADHDDRVVPAHSFKFAAALQAAQAGDRPVLIRIETEAGHGAGKPTDKVIDEKADVFAFLVKVLGMTTSP